MTKIDATFTSLRNETPITNGWTYVQEPASNESFGTHAATTITLQEWL